MGVSRKNIPPLTEQQVLRFWNGVDKSNDCWHWTKSINLQGYGRFNIAGGIFQAHRVAYKLYYQIDPQAKHVCHRCDTPSCVNPAHLFLGTDLDNAQDRDGKGRNSSVGAGNKHAKLTDQDVLAIRERAFAGETHTSIAADIGLTNSAVSRIVKRRRWQHI